MKVLLYIKHIVELEVPLGTTGDEIQQIVANDLEVHFHWGNDKIHASKEEIEDVELITESLLINFFGDEA